MTVAVALTSARGRHTHGILKAGQLFLRRVAVSIGLFKELLGDFLNPSPLYAASYRGGHRSSSSPSTCKAPDAQGAIQLSAAPTAAVDVRVGFASATARSFPAWGAGPACPPPLTRLSLQEPLGLFQLLTFTHPTHPHAFLFN